jgi:uncharacterized protein
VLNIAAEYLYAYRPFVLKNIQFLTALGGIAYQSLAADELGVHHISPVLLAYVTEGRIAHILHRRQQQREFSQVDISYFYSHAVYSLQKYKKLSDSVNIPYKQTYPDKKPMHPGVQFLLYGVILLFAIFVGSIIGVVVDMIIYGTNILNSVKDLDIHAPHVVNALWIVQFAGMTMPILGTPIFFAYVVTDEPNSYLHTSFRFPWVLLVIGFGISLFAFPVIELLSNINHLIPLPSWLKWMDNSEENEKIMAAMIDMKSIGDMIYDVLFIGLLTAVAEEFAFRGCLQTIFLRWTKNIHVAVWVTAIIFSAFHMEYFGFLPRVFLGAMFGYFVAWSGSIWTSVWGHFLNNGTIVVLTYLYESKHSKISPDDDHVFNYPLYIISFVIIVFLYAIYRRIALYRRPVIQ